MRKVVEADYAPVFDRSYSVVPVVGCWMWMRGLTHEDYPILFKGVLAHRYAYQRFVGQLVKGLVIDHLCRNHWCVNPDHLEQVTNVDNVMRGTGFAARNRDKTECPLGHRYSPENTKIRNGSWRSCRECERARDRKRWPARRDTPGYRERFNKRRLEARLRRTGEANA